MRALLVLFAVFAAGLLIGHEFWPQSHPDPAWHLRFHRGKIPPFASQQETTNKPHGRILHKPAPQTN